MPDEHMVDIADKSENESMRVRGMFSVGDRFATTKHVVNPKNCVPDG